jgi:hypothetical protein
MQKKGLNLNIPLWGENRPPFISRTLKVKTSDIFTLLLYFLGTFKTTPAFDQTPGEHSWSSGELLV